MIASKKKKAKVDKEDNAQMTEAKDAPILHAVDQADKKQVIKGDTLYNELVKEESSPNKELSGIKALKNFHMKSAETYDKVKESIFFVG